jgi:signal transduction histidine kinase
MGSLLFRIGLVMSAAFLLLVMVLAGLAWVQSREVGLVGGAPLPTSRQLSAMVDLVEGTGPDALPGVLEALDTGTRRVSVTADPPRGTEAFTLPGLRLALGAYRRALDGRPVRAMVRAAPGDMPPGVIRWRDRFWLDNPLRLVVGLRDGRSLVIELRSRLAAPLTGLRLSALALVASLAILGIAFLLLRRQLRPLRRLADGVERFGASVTYEELPQAGSREVRQLIAAFNRLQGQVRDLVAGRSRLMAAIGHDLNTYLTRLRLRVEYIADDDQRARAAEDIAAMQAMMADALTLARLDHDAEGLQTLDLGALLRERIGRLADPERSLVKLADARPAVLAPGRPAALGRAVDNLIANALKYAGAVDVTVARREGMAEMLFEDRGPGIPDAEKAAVMEPFYRRDAARNLDRPGSGLGLAIVADIVARHNGTVALEDREGGGLRVRLRLPAGS